MLSDRGTLVVFPCSIDSLGVCTQQHVSRFRIPWFFLQLDRLDRVDVHQGCTHGLDKH